MKIFINIASYRDPLLLTTIYSAYYNAKDKENLVFGIVEQEYADKSINMDLLEFKDQIRYIRIDPFYARGACWPRHMAQIFWQGETYYLQIDSHTIFDLNWDEILIDQYAELKLYHEKPVITVYPSGFSINENDSTKSVKHKIDGCLALVADEQNAFKDNSDMYVGAKTNIINKKIVHGYMISGNCLFTAGKVIEEVPYDPFLYFSGEEHSFALRLWTNGYNIFHTDTNPIYHHYSRDYRTPVWDDDLLEKSRPVKWWEYDIESKKRLNSIVTGEDLGIYGVGKTRTLKQYIEFSGIDYFTRTLHEKSKTGKIVFSIDYKNDITLGI